MRRYIYNLSLVLFVITANPAFATLNCASALQLNFPDVHLDTAVLVAEPVPHCKVKGVIGGKIGFSIWLPEQWNGRFVMGGAGGFVRPEDNQALRLIGDDVLRQGFATASTDTGHQAEGQDASWAQNDFEAIVNYAHLAMHRAVVTSKAVLAGHYGKPADKSFFIGCSNGGRQALLEAQRYPNDFDAIIAGAPASNFTGVTAAFLNITQHMFPDPNNLTTPVITKADRQLLRSAILTQCDALDGLTDGILHDPTECKFDVQTLQCAGGSSMNCLSARKVAAIEAVYRGPRNSQGYFYTGFPFGAEDIDANGWGSWLSGGLGIPTAAFNFGVGMMRNFVHHNANWSYVNYNWDHFLTEIGPLGHMINATNPDLSAFRNQGGKLLLYHGWADVALSAHMTTDYVRRVYATDPSAREDVRLFMMPGVLHCYGGHGPSIVNWLNTIETWHDSGAAPKELVAAYPDKPGARKLCQWPERARYITGNADTPDAYRCE